MSITKKVYIVHGWDGYPEEGWFPWLQQELEARGFSVIVPQLPKPDEPRIGPWVNKLAEVVQDPDSQTYFVGHSMGCQAIVRYIEGLSRSVRIGGAVFVAGFFKRLTHLEDDPLVRSVADEWLGTPIDFEKVKANLKDSVAIFSDDDRYVPLDTAKDFVDAFGSDVVIEHSKGHFSGSTGTIQLPSALEAVLKLAEEKN